MNARSVISINAASAATGVGDFSEPVDSPDRMLSSHSNAAVWINRTSAGTACPSESRITSPRTRLRTSTSTNLPSRRTVALWRIRECIAAAACSARYSLKNPSPMLTARITPMINAWLWSPRKYDSTAVMASKISTALFSWRTSTAHALTRWVWIAFGPYCAKRSRAWASDSPSAEVSSRRKTCSTEAAATVCAVTGSRIAGTGGLDVMHTFERWLKPMTSPLQTNRLRHQAEGPFRCPFWGFRHLPKV